MRQAVAIAFPNMQPSPFVEGEIRRRAAKLDAQCPGIVSCHIVVDIPHRHHKKGNLFRVHMTIKVRGDEVVVIKEGVPSALRRVVREAFEVATRQLHDSNSLRRDARREAPRRRPAVQAQATLPGRKKARTEND